VPRRTPWFDLETDAGDADAGDADLTIFFQIAEGLFAALPIRAMDITEIAPRLDVNDITTFLGIQIVLETAALLDRARRHPSSGTGRPANS
jgi:hypothetical protein